MQRSLEQLNKKMYQAQMRKESWTWTLSNAQENLNSVEKEIRVIEMQIAKERVRIR